MKRLLILSSLLVAGMVPSLQAQTAAPAKVAVVAFQAAVAQTNEFQRDFADLSKKFDPKRAEIQKLGAEIDALTKELQTQGDKLSEVELARRQKSLDDKQKQGKRLSEDAQAEFQQEMQALANRIAAKFGEVLQQYATAQGYTMAIDISQAEDQPPLVLWADPSVNITAGAIAAYNTKSGVPAPAAAPAAK